MRISERIQSIYGGHGGAAYFGEDVTITEHGLQAAYFAQRAGADEALVVAALLHDIGHLIVPAEEDIQRWISDARHEVSGSRWLSAHFGPEISEPVRLHVPAKRYLCATDPAYHGKLSSASVHTLQLQGGPMSSQEVRAFEGERFARQAVLVRQCDDLGKVAGLRVPPLPFYGEVIERLSRPNAARDTGTL